MDINVNLDISVKIRAFYLFFLITSVQLGVGTMGAPRYIFMITGQDAWVSILLAHLFIMLTVAVMFTILNQYDNTDIFGIQVDVFGNVIGKFLGVIYIVYFGMTLVTILSTYIEVVRIFLFPTFPTYVLGFLILFLAIYAIFGGIRVMTGVCFLFFLSSQIFDLLLYDPMSQMDWGHFLPMFEATPTELLQGIRATMYTNAGFEILFLLYPFIENKEKAKLPAFLAVTYSSFILLLTTVISIGYFSLEYIASLEWGLLTLLKSISFTFLERIDYFVVIVWLMLIIPNNILVLWSMSYGLKRLYNIKQKYSIYVLAGITLIIVGVFKYDYKILKLTDYVSKFSFWLIFIYPFFLLPCVLFKKRWDKRKGVDNQ